MPRSHKVRVTVDLSPDLDSKLYEVARAVEGQSKAATLRIAIRLLAYLASVEKRGGRLLVRESDRRAREFSLCFAQWR